MEIINQEKVIPADIAFNLLLQADDDDLTNLFQANSIFRRYLDDNFFWQERFQEVFGSKTWLSFRPAEYSYWDWYVLVSTLDHRNDDISEKLALDENLTILRRISQFEIVIGSELFQSIDNCVKYTAILDHPENFPYFIDLYNRFLAKNGIKSSWKNLLECAKVLAHLEDNRYFQYFFENIGDEEIRDGLREDLIQAWVKLMESPRDIPTIEAIDYLAAPINSLPEDISQLNYIEAAFFYDDFLANRPPDNDQVASLFQEWELAEKNELSLREELLERYSIDEETTLSQVYREGLLDLAFYLAILYSKGTNKMDRINQVLADREIIPAIQLLLVETIIKGKLQPNYRDRIESLY